MSIDHRAQSESILLLEKDNFPHSSLPVEKHFIFLMVIFTAQYLEGRKGFADFRS